MKPLQWLLDLLYPPKCPFCGRILERGEDGMCALCQRELPWTDGPGTPADCCDCCLAPLYYRDGKEDRVRSGVHRYKFKGGASHARLFGTLAAQCLADRWDEPVDLITWVPLHPEKKRRRGYDQAELMARRVGEVSGIAVVPALEKIRATGTQSHLNDGAERRANVEGAYRALPELDLTGKRVVLVDDVFTTGSTMGQCAACLRGAGAERVVGLTFAQAGRKGGPSLTTQESKGY